MGRAPSHKNTNRIVRRKGIVISCSKQFPDCPLEPNDVDCKVCPLYKK